jgi:predicted HAD superfamily hydrolase
MSTTFNPKEEIKAEYVNCKANPYILEMYNKGEADYIFISDMYLPSTVIKSMLEKCGYKDPKV